MYIGVDLGTSSAKLLVLSKQGEVLLTLHREYPLYFPQKLYSEQNPKDWYDAVVSGLKELAQSFNPQELEGIGFSGQMHGLVLLDEMDEVLRPAILWNDQRTGEECDYLNHVIGREKLSEYTANMALTGFTAPKLLWVQKHEPELFKRIAKIMLPKDYVAYKLSGVFATDVSDASGTLYFDVKNKKWSQDMLVILSIKKEQLPKVFESYEVIGTMTESAARETGLNPALKIIIGGGDQAVGAVGTGTVTNGAAVISLGTSGVVFVSSDEFQADRENRLHSFCHANGKYHLMGVILNAASSLKWYIENILKSNDFDRIINEIDMPSKEDTLYFLPYLLGERTPVNDPFAKGAFIGLSLNHERKALTRAVLEGVAFALKDTLEIIKSLGISVKKARITGGGAQSPIWVQMIADVLNLEIETITANEGPALGAAILASVGCGAYENVGKACQAVIHMQSTIIPNPEYTDLYEHKYRIYQSLYPSLKPVFLKINE